MQVELFLQWMTPTNSQKCDITAKLEEPVGCDIDRQGRSVLKMWLALVSAHVTHVLAGLGFEGPGFGFEILALTTSLVLRSCYSVCILAPMSIVG